MLPKNAAKKEGLCPMTLDIRPILRGEVSSLDLDFTLMPAPIDRITFSGDAYFIGKITDNAGYIRLMLRAELPYDTECDRCLAPVHGVFALDLEKTVVTEGMLEGDEEDNDEYVVAVDGFLDIDELLGEMVLLEFPTKILCEEDCPGLCEKCGKPKREGECSCVKKEIDPRLAILQKLLDK